jgi:hypothetical protein
MVNWHKRTAIALVVLGFVLMLGGWRLLETGDVVYAFPLWVLDLGGAIVAIGAFLYVLSWK